MQPDAVVYNILLEFYIGKPGKEEKVEAIRDAMRTGDVRGDGRTAALLLQYKLQRMAATPDKRCGMEGHWYA